MHKQETWTLKEDEPTFTIRGQDATALMVLDYYIQCCRLAGSPESHIEEVRKIRTEFREWQVDFPPKIPD